MLQTQTSNNELKIAENQDISGIFRLWKMMYNENIERTGLLLDEDRLIHNIKSLVDNESCVIMTINGRQVGFLAWVVNQSIYSQQDLIAHEVGWYIEPDYRHSGYGIKMIEYFEEIVKQLGARYAVIARSLTYKKLRRGYRDLEIHYLKEVS